VTANVTWEFGSGRPYTRAYGYDLALDVNTQLSPPTGRPGRALVLFDEPYGRRLPAYHRLDMSVSRPFKLTRHTNLEGEVGVINLYNRRNIFYYDVGRDNVVNQIPFYPYVSISINIE